MSICPACGYPSVGVCAACTVMSADPLGKTINSFAAISVIAERGDTLISTQSDHFGTRAAARGAPAILGPV
jgi:cobalamin biosynthesis protein CbiG